MRAVAWLRSPLTAAHCMQTSSIAQVATPNGEALERHLGVAPSALGVLVHLGPKEALTIAALQVLHVDALPH